jgi:hypothetical protein
LNNPGGDPTPRTIEQVNQATKSLRELIEARLEESGKAVRLLQENANRQPVPEVLDARLIAVSEKMEIRFSEMDKRNDAVAASNQKSIDLALQAQKEAAAKSENAFNKQIDALNQQLVQATRALETRLNDTKETVDKIEAGGQGKQQNQTGMIAVAGLVIAATMAAIAVFSNLGS